MVGYPGRATSRSALQVHFVHCHVWDTVVILEEGSQPLPLCPECGMFVTWQILNVKHQAAEICVRGEEQNRGRKWGEESRISTEVAFQDYGIPLVAVSEFKYLGRILTVLDEYWPEVVGNFREARNQWAWMSRILGR